MKEEENKKKNMKNEGNAEAKKWRSREENQEKWKATRKNVEYRKGKERKEECAT